MAWGGNLGWCKTVVNSVVSEMGGGGCGGRAERVQRPWAGLERRVLLGYTGGEWLGGKHSPGIAQDIKGPGPTVS